MIFKIHFKIGGCKKILIFRTDKAVTYRYALEHYLLGHDHLKFYDGFQIKTSSITRIKHFPRDHCRVMWVLREDGQIAKIL